MAILWCAYRSLSLRHSMRSSLIYDNGDCCSLHVTEEKIHSQIDAGSMPPLRSLDGQLSIFPHGAPESVGDAGLEVERAERGIAGIARTPPLWRRRCCGGTCWPPHFEIVSSVTRSVQTPTGCRARLELVPAIGHLGNDSPHDLDGGWSRKGRPASKSDSAATGHRERRRGPGTRSGRPARLSRHPPWRAASTTGQRLSSTSGSVCRT